jgi:hypothetical protein
MASINKKDARLPSKLLAHLEEIAIDSLILNVKGDSLHNLSEKYWLKLLDLLKLPLNSIK